MSKKLAVLFSLLGMLIAGQTSAAIAYAPPACYGGHWYGSVFGGANWLQLSDFPKDYSARHFEPGYQAGLALGYQMASPFRLEAEVSYRQNSLNHIEHLQMHHLCHLKARTWAYMGNLIVDADCGTIKPYAGLGLGYAHTDGNDRVQDAPIQVKDQGLAWQAIGGISVPVTTCLDLGVEYRFFQARANARDHSINLALRQAF